MRVRSFRRGFVRLYAVDCSTEETEQVKRIDREQILRLARGMQRQLGVCSSPPGIKVLCFGIDANLSETPPPINRWCGPASGRGVWLRQVRCALARFDADKTIRQIVIHEVAHALLDLLTGGFPYPLAIAEGVARRAEYLLPDASEKPEWRSELERHGKKASRYLGDSECMSIKELLFFNCADQAEKDVVALGNMTNLAFWLNLYLSKLSQDHPKLEGMLGKLREQRTAWPAAVYQWLQEASGMGEEELEEGFHRFCTKGTLSGD